jgi:AraC-like DNA-binding protein
MTNVRISNLVRECQIFAGQSVALPAGDARRLFVRDFVSRLPDPVAPLERIVFSGLLLNVALRWSEQLHKHHHQLHPGPCVFDPSCELHQHWRHTDRSPTQIFETWSRAFLDAFERTHPLSAAARVKEIIDGGNGVRVNLHLLARNTGCHPSRLRSLFKASFGMPIREYQTRRQVAYAVRLLATSDLKISAVAFTTGFRSRKNFYDAFRRLAGATPSTVRDWSQADIEWFEQTLETLTGTEERR